MLKLLVHLGADREARDDQGRSPLHVATVKGQTQAIATLVQLGLSVDVGDTLGRLPIHHAAMAGQTGSLIALVERGAEVDACTPKGRTAVHAAAIAGQVGLGHLPLGVCVSTRRQWSGDSNIKKSVHDPHSPGE